MAGSVLVYLRAAGSLKGKKIREKLLQEFVVLVLQ